MEKLDNRAIAKRIKEVRTYFKLRQEDFAIVIGIRQPTLAQFESGEIIIKDKYIKLICSEFNVKREWLLYGNGDMLNEPQSVPLEEFISIYNLSPLETELLQSYLEINKGVREYILEKLMRTILRYDKVNQFKYELKMKDDYDMSPEELLFKKTGANFIQESRKSYKDKPE